MTCEFVFSFSLSLSVLRFRNNSVCSFDKLLKLSLQLLSLDLYHPIISIKYKAPKPICALLKSSENEPFEDAFNTFKTTSMTFPAQLYRLKSASFIWYFVLGTQTFLLSILFLESSNSISERCLN